ncbi:MAG TPA: hypothetical protein VGO93_18455 [Candidatus Xenobia bacterium]|jgi:hypothetical protein
MGYGMDCERVEGIHRRPGRVSLENDLLEFRGSDTRTRIGVADVSAIEVRDGILSLTYSKGTLHLDLGEEAEKWAHRLRHPPSRLDKLGIQPGDRVRRVGDFPDDFCHELTVLPVTDAEPPTWILFMAPTPQALHRLPPLGTARALWIVYPRREVREADVLQAGRSAGLLDTKVLRFSPTHTGLKFVARKSKRP